MIRRWYKIILQFELLVYLINKYGFMKNLSLSIYIYMKIGFSWLDLININTFCLKMFVFIFL